MKKILNILISLLNLVKYSKTQNEDLCQNPQDPDTCNLVPNLITEEFYFDFTGKNKQFSIIGLNCNIFAYRNFSIKVPSDDFSVTISLKSCQISSRDVSIDLGGLETGSTLSLDTASSINSNYMSNLTAGVPVDPLNREMICYTGCNVIDSGIVYGAGDINYDITQGDNEKIRMMEFYGSGDDNQLYQDNRFTWGGGRVYIRASYLKFSDIASTITSNGFQGDDAQKQGIIISRSGTGGCVMIASKSIEFGIDQKEKLGIKKISLSLGNEEHPKQIKIRSQIQAEGSNHYGQLNTNLGGGGRIFIVVTEMQFPELEKSVSVTGYGLSKSDYRANSGRVMIITTEANYMVAKNLKDSYSLKTAGTLFDFQTPSPTRNNIAVFYNCNVTNYLKNDIAYYYSVTVNSSTYYLVNMSPPSPPTIPSYMMKIGSLTVLDQAAIYVNVSAFYEISSTEGLFIGDYSNITIFQGSFVKLTGPIVQFTGNSLANIFKSDNIYSNLRPPTILIVESDEIKIVNSVILSDKVFLNPTSRLSINNSYISNIKSSCPSEASSIKMDWFLRNCDIGSQELSGDCKNIWDQIFMEVELPNLLNRRFKGNLKPNDLTLETNVSFVLINFPGHEWQTNYTRIYNVGYFGLKAQNFTLEETSSIITSASGCQALNPEIDSTLSKYIKHCKVKGGSNIGRGTMGRMVNLQLCNFLMPLPKNPIYEYTAVPGEGGQKSHQTEDSSNLGYGGGIINIFTAENTIIKGFLASDGGKSNINGFTMVAGGAGGSIKISSNKIIFYENDSSQQTSDKKPQLSVQGGDSSDQLGAGGGGKIILNCSNWETDADCIQVFGYLNISTKSGDFKHDPNKPLYFLTMNMMEEPKDFIFNGGVMNLNGCLQGRQGPFCELCPKGTYKKTVDTTNCIPCPCDSSSDVIGATSINDCDCSLSRTQGLTIVKIGAIFFVFIVFLMFFHIIMKKKKKYEDKNYLSDLRYKVNDIPNSYGRIYVIGGNTPHQPWKIDRLDPEISKYFQVKNFNMFREELEKAASWSNIIIYVLTVINVLFYSPIYLSILRILRITRVNNMIQLLERQSSFNIFKEPRDKKSKNKPRSFVLKWTTTSDQSTLFLDIVRKTGDEKIKFNWKLKFPQSFIIFGNGTYNRPFKLEFRDPLLIKMVDHLKDIVNDSERYHSIFNIPSYIVNSIKIINQESHFMEYFFCIFNTHLKSLDTLGNKGNFIFKFKQICSYLQKANNLFMGINGYFFRLELILKNTKKSRTRKEHLDIPLSSPKEIKEAASFFYDVANYSSDSTRCTLLLWIDESKFLIMNKKLKNRTGQVQGHGDEKIPKKRRSFSVNRIALVMEQQRARKMSDDFRKSILTETLLNDKAPDVFSLSMANNQIVRLKNEYRRKIINQQKAEAEIEFDYTHMRTVFVDNKKFNPLSDNFVVRFLSFYIYKQYMVSKKMNYLTGVIFILLIFQMSSLLFSIYNVFFENLTGSTEVINFVVLEWIAPFPFSQFFSMALGITCVIFQFITNWKVKVGKMFVSANMICVVNLITAFFIWSFLLLIYKSAHYDYVMFYFLPNLIVRVILSHIACLEVSKVQAAKTMGKILKARHFHI